MRLRLRNEDPGAGECRIGGPGLLGVPREGGFVMKKRRFTSWWVYHENKGCIRGPFKTREAAEKVYDQLIAERAGLVSWLAVVPATRGGREKAWVI